ncbi:MAG: alginate O-acetyltransferase [Omnitrophica WOR_2 bacterium GWF2_38_59]|nr:MAG: alginate O-acetyltransferase [Omnitrophica WOR_2 bacterium GWF2_38_59]OGX48675.1 MAG: alginate O-acetyltransferase [Omnitrophica WOR_2 bacterium RIFOXYA2_FULL_38_17]OGX53494.1 MAG: alginate O-acetyltransferase [Omnitrophica WOR_2 bacterium RIFOXYA12_FULL_38_10]OGX57207.1 MAG: alginate O-acetyltransferase [Omnitrophica WOR_2 bacterium RIFOXYB2_FULL_38_16]HBG61955.1 membrane-bound O-acyltransferase family protein [Candidatus Omnitrophota bacterium]
MLFNSLQFFFFFPAVVILYFLIANRWRWIFLLSASYYFYMCWKAEYVLLIILSTSIDYFIGLKLENVEDQRKRKALLLFSIISNLSILVAFKYFNFFSESLRLFLNQFNVLYNETLFKVALPIGISFYTFQSLSYSIDVYRKKIDPERHWGKFALYVAFFPQLVAGPIERAGQLLPQLKADHRFEHKRIKSGLLLMAWGFFKKLVIADRVAVAVNQVYNNPHDYTGIALIIATYFFAYQIYCDFSGYSDIAIGASRVLGIELAENFNYPYLSRSIEEFWGRWHMTLCRWFKDYLYIPLGGNRVVAKRWCINIMIVFVLSGLWHGANWTFIVWGAFHGFMLIINKILSKSRITLAVPQAVKNICKGILTFHLVCLGWIVFRANSLSDALYIIQHIFVDWQISLRSYGLELGSAETILAVFAILILELMQFLQRRFKFSDRILECPIILRWGFYYGIIWSILVFGKIENQIEFIYFQF